MSKVVDIGSGSKTATSDALTVQVLYQFERSTWRTTQKPYLSF